MRVSTHRLAKSRLRRLLAGRPLRWVSQLFTLRSFYQFCSQLGFSLILTPAAMPSAANMVTIDVPP